MAKISSYTTVTPVGADLLIGTDDVGGTNATKNFTADSIAALAGAGGHVTLQQVLDANNTATQSINLTGNISLTGTLTASNGAGTAGQVLSSQGAGNPAQWVDHSTLGPNIEEVLTVGNTATTAIILNGNATFGSTITDGSASVGSAGQVLSSTVTGVQWVTTTTPDLQAVLTEGNASTLSIALGGTATLTTYGATVGASGLTLTGPFSANGGVGTAGQVLVSQGAGLSPQWSTGGSGTVTSITAGTGLNGGTITGSGTIDLANTTVTAGSYTSANITVDAQGRLTAASNGGGGGGSSLTHVIKNTAYTAVDGEMVGCRILASPFTISPPAAPAAGARFGVQDISDNAAAHSITIDFNTQGTKWNTQTTDLVMSKDSFCVIFEYINATYGWALVGGAIP